MRSEFYFSIIGILGLIVISLLIGLIVVASNQSKPLISFSHYSAECLNMFTNGDKTGLERTFTTKEVVFNEYKWYEEIYDETELISRSFSTEKDGSTTRCEHIGNHGNCYVSSGSETKGFTIPRSAVKQQSEMDCSDIGAMIGRELKTCDVYSYAEGGSALVKVTVESGNNYPVHVEMLVDDDSLAIYRQTFYTKFDADKPTDKSGLEAFEGVKIYDFRDGKGDAGKGSSNLYTKTSNKSEGWKNWLMKGITGVQSLWNEEKEDDVFEEYKKKRDSLLYRKPMMGVPSKYVKQSGNGRTRDKKAAIPNSFDARESWKDCKEVIGNIRDQGECGSCWAMAGAGVLSDRYCIASMGGVKSNLSAQYLVYCAKRNNGCSGSMISQYIWEDMKDIGLPSEECVPFEGRNGACPKRCEDGSLITEGEKVRPSGYAVPWANDDKERVEAIQEEIMKNGPVEGFFLVYSDFNLFFAVQKKGIYHRTEKAYCVGQHAIRIIGWGSESGQDYWLIANSYGANWGSGGLFRMRRGNNECNLEEQIIAGIIE